MFIRRLEGSVLFGTGILVRKLEIRENVCMQALINRHQTLVVEDSIFPIAWESLESFRNDTLSYNNSTQSLVM